jgi:hypothetical protein
MIKFFFIEMLIQIFAILFYCSNQILHLISLVVNKPTTPSSLPHPLAPSPLHFALKAKVFRPAGLKAREEFY